jgi:hypothetical protein
VLSDAQWVLLEPLIEVCRPKGKTPPQNLRRKGGNYRGSAFARSSPRNRPLVGQMALDHLN